MVIRKTNYLALQELNHNNSNRNKKAKLIKSGDKKVSNLEKL